MSSRPESAALVAALCAAAHNCFDDGDDCQGEDPIYVSAMTADRVTEISGSPEAIVEAVLAGLDTEPPAASSPVVDPQ